MTPRKRPFPSRITEKKKKKENKDAGNKTANQGGKIKKDCPKNSPREKSQKLCLPKGTAGTARQKEIHALKEKHTRFKKRGRPENHQLRGERRRGQARGQMWETTGDLTDLPATQKGKGQSGGKADSASGDAGSWKCKPGQNNILARPKGFHAGERAKRSA